jgi:hypothetical protein
MHFDALMEAGIGIGGERRRKREEREGRKEKVKQPWLNSTYCNASKSFSTPYYRTS